MTPPDPASPPIAGQRFAERFSTWGRLHLRLGAGRSYPYAWRLPELARPLGKGPLDQARHALALDLHTLGRFAEALAALRENADTLEDRTLRHRLNLLLDCPEPGEPREGDLSVAEAHYLAYLQDRPRVLPATEPDPMPETERLWASVLLTWCAARKGQGVSLKDSHRALARLRVLHPARAAQAEAVHAETVYCLGPRWAPMWLDHALDGVDRFSQHHLKARLLGLKARALEAAGALGEGARFRKQARALAERQGARLYLRLFIDDP